MALTFLYKKSPIFNGRQNFDSPAGRGPHLEKVPASTLKDKQARGRPAMGPNDSMAGVSLKVIKFNRGLYVIFNMA